MCFYIETHSHKNKKPNITKKKTTLKLCTNEKYYFLWRHKFAYWIFVLCTCFIPKSCFCLPQKYIIIFYNHMCRGYNSCVFSLYIYMLVINLIIALHVRTLNMFLWLLLCDIAWMAKLQPKIYTKIYTNEFELENYMFLYRYCCPHHGFFCWYFACKVHFR